MLERRDLEDPEMRAKLVGTAKMTPCVFEAKFASAVAIDTQRGVTQESEQGHNDKVKRS